MERKSTRDPDTGERGHSAAKAWLRALELTAPIAKHPTRTLAVLIEELAEKVWPMRRRCFPIAKP